MNNFLSIMALDERQMRSVIFVNARQEGGINEVFDPALGRFVYQVFIHNQFPYGEAASFEFETFAKARSYAAEAFGTQWEMLVWDKDIKRPCDSGGGCGSGKKEGGGCGSGGGCSTSGGGCGSSGGGCGSSGGGCSNKDEVGCGN